jgi:hypothetical protein
VKAQSSVLNFRGRVTFLFLKQWVRFHLLMLQNVRDGCPFGRESEQASDRVPRGDPFGVAKNKDKTEGVT